MAAPSRPHPATAGQIVTGAGRLTGLQLSETSGTNPLTVTLYDNTGPSGTKLADIRIPAGQTTVGRITTGGVVYDKGIHLTVAGTGTLVGAIYTN